MRRKFKYPQMPEVLVPVLRRRQRVSGAVGASESPVLSSISVEAMSRLRQAYLFRGEDVVWRYLRQYPFLVEPLLEGIVAIRRIFGAQTQVVLEVVADYECRWYEELCVYVQVKGDRKEAYRRLVELDECWSIPALPQTNGQIVTFLEENSCLNGPIVSS